MTSPAVSLMHWHLGVFRSTEKLNGPASCQQTLSYTSLKTQYGDRESQEALDGHAG